MTKKNHCIICESDTSYFFTKSGFKAPYESFSSFLGQVDYHKCRNCGFTFSKTLYELEGDKWETLNHDFHHFIENNNNLATNQPPYLQQALLLSVLHRNQLVNLSTALDYGAGPGTLSITLSKYFSQKLKLYEPFEQIENLSHLYIDNPKSGEFGVVITSALFEHLMTRESFNEIDRLVSADGCLIIHTVICENIPKDPNWFYLEVPVHCSFHTNKSMDVLMKDWGYECSIYCPAAKSWVLFKNAEHIENTINSINKEFQNPYLHFKHGFVDFWKGF